MFSPVDFVVFGAFLLLSLCVGLYHGVVPALRPSPTVQSRSKTGDFLDGGRRLPVLPVCLSLLTTFVSGFGILGVPAEIYTRGSAMALFNLFGCLAFPMISAFFIPIFFKLKCLNAYEYFEMRFHSGLLRRMATLIFILNTLVYMAVVIYAPSIALAGVTSLPLWPLILLVGCVSTVYTAAGGIKAVIWTDTLQAVFIYAGLGIIIVKGTLQAGGFWHVFQVNEETGRLWQGFRLNPSPLQYNNIWVESIGGIVQWTCIYGLSQMAMQRFCSMPSLGNARLVLSLTIPANFLIQLMVAYIGFLMVAFFDGCDPVALDELATIDQLTILMANRIFEGVPGLPGLFLATIFSATLSTASSGINSLTAVVWEDFLKDGPVGRRLSDTGSARLMKIISGKIYGIKPSHVPLWPSGQFPPESDVPIQLYHFRFAHCPSVSHPMQPHVPTKAQSKAEMVNSSVARDRKNTENRDSRSRFGTETRDRDRDLAPRLETEIETPKKPGFFSFSRPRPRFFSQN